MPSGEKGRKARCQQLVGLFLRSALQATISKLRPFPAIVRAIRVDFSALQTAWRREKDSNPRYGFSEPPRLDVSATCISFCNSNIHSENSTCIEQSTKSPSFAARQTANARRWWAERNSNLWTISQTRFKDARLLSMAWPHSSMGCCCGSNPNEGSRLGRRLSAPIWDRRRWRRLARGV